MGPLYLYIRGNRSSAANDLFSLRTDPFCSGTGWWTFPQTISNCKWNRTVSSIRSSGSFLRLRPAPNRNRIMRRRIWWPLRLRNSESISFVPSVDRRRRTSCKGIESVFYLEDCSDCRSGRGFQTVEKRKLELDLCCWCSEMKLWTILGKVFPMNLWSVRTRWTPPSSESVRDLWMATQFRRIWNHLLQEKFWGGHTFIRSLRFTYPQMFSP